MHLRSTSAAQLRCAPTPRLRPACTPLYGPQATFHNITRIMDCVGCEKCKMWAKLQVGAGQLLSGRVTARAGR